VQAGTGDPSPSNPRPISGHSSVTVSHSGEDTSDATTYTRAFLDSNDDPITVYGGTLDLITGEGTITHAVVDMGELTWSKTSTLQHTLFFAFITDKKYNNSNMLCDHYDNKGIATGNTFLNNLPDNSICSSTTNSIYVRDDRFANMTPEEMTEAIAGTKLVYELETPVDDFYCEPLILETLKGANNIWADTGDTAIDYKQDIQTYIDSRLSSGTRSLSLAKAPVEEKEETKQEEQEGDESLTR
jgi:hypothetical protein